MMKKTMTRIGALILCLALCLSLCVTASAAGSTVTVTASDVSYSTEAQTVTVTIAVDPGADITAYGGNVLVPDGWSVDYDEVTISGTDTRGRTVNDYAPVYADNNNSFNNTYANGMTATSIEIVYNVPAGASDTFTLGVDKLILSKDGANQLDGDNDGVTATTTVTLTAPAGGSTVTATAEPVSYSEEAQTVTVTIAVDPGADITAYGGNVLVPDGWSVDYDEVTISGTDSRGRTVNDYAPVYADNNNSFNNTYANGMTATSIEIVYNVPAGANGKFTLGADKLILSKDGQNQLAGDNNGVTASVEVTITAPTVPTTPVAQVFGFTLTLKGEIGVNAYLCLNDEVVNSANAGDYQVEFWQGDTLASATLVSAALANPREETVGGKTYTMYPFSFTTVPKEMDTEYTMKIKQISADEYVSFADQSGVTVTELVRTVNTYLDDRLQNSENDEMKNLAASMQEYGAFAAYYFKDEEPTAEEIAALPEVTDPLPDYPQTVESIDEHFEYVGSTLVLESETSFRLYFKSDDTSKLSITCKAKVTADTAKDMTICKGTGKNSEYFYVEVSDIPAKDLSTMYTFSVSYNGGSPVTLDHGPFGYISWALQQTDGSHDKLICLVRALYDYNQKAIAYFNQP